MKTESPVIRGMYCSIVYNSDNGIVLFVFSDFRLTSDILVGSSIVDFRSAHEVFIVHITQNANG